MRIGLHQIVAGVACVGASLICAACVAFAQVPPRPEPGAIRIATFNASLNRKGPGVLLKALEKGKDSQIEAVADIIRIVRPDILLINEFDHDPEGRALALFQAWLRRDGVQTFGLELRHAFTTPPNTGVLSGHDLDRDGKTRRAEDAFGYGRFPGQYGMLLLSRLPIDHARARSFSKLLWRDLPGADMPVDADGSPYPTAAAQAVLRLSSKSHWDVPVQIGGVSVHIWASHPTPPVFDGPEDFNGRRNRDEIRFWSQYLDGYAPMDDAGTEGGRAEAPFVILGDLNADPEDGEGAHAAIKALLSHAMIVDPQPRSAGGQAASGRDGGANRRHKGDAATDTADWNDTRGPGNLRVDYVLPSRALRVVASGVFWPTEDEPLYRLIGSGKPVSSDHRLVWVDVHIGAE